jgi:hypothetical protein
VDRQCFSVSGSRGSCERCKHDNQSCSWLKAAAKESKGAKEIKVKKEPGADEAIVSGTKVGTKRKATGKVEDRGTKPKPKKSRASSFASGDSTRYSRRTSMSYPSLPSSSIIGDEDFEMDDSVRNPPVDNANSVGQVLVILDALEKNAEGVMKGAKLLKAAIKDLGLGESNDGADV